MDFKGTGLKGVASIHLARDMVKWHVPANTTVKLRLPRKVKTYCSR